ncbi:hypothetical protein [Zavarzinia sp. CC-PAN008]|uniref:hypothetical protein n=1 Tax=Zavarzinia sp. CC-PAN008 TaxID=3243332 RepID=UPI003F74711A
MARALRSRPALDAPVLSFEGGVLGARLLGRTDLGAYYSGCRSALNFQALAQGPARFRPGTRHAAVAKLLEVESRRRLIPFIFSAAQAYAIEAGPLYFRFFRNHGPVMKPAPDEDEPFEVVTPYGEGDLAGLKWAQSGDVLRLACGATMPRKLERRGDTDWSLVAIDPKGGPWRPENGSDTTITPSGVTGSVTLTASADLFDSSWIGQRVRLRTPSGTVPERTWKEETLYLLGNVVTYLGRVYEAVAYDQISGEPPAFFSFTTPPTHDKGDASDGNTTWRFLHDGSGYAVITAVSNATTATATVVERLPYAAATTFWAEGAWHARHGFPRAVVFYNDRVVWGGTTSDPQTVWASRVGDYDNFRPGRLGYTRADDALSFTISDAEVNAIRWLTAGDDLLCGTMGGIIPLGPATTTEAFGPDNAKTRNTVRVGAEPDPVPLRIGDGVIYVGRGGLTLEELAPERAPSTRDLTLRSDDVTVGGVVDLAWALRPDKTLWAVRGDGALLSLVYEPSEEVLGWMPHRLGGRYLDGPPIVEACCVIPTPDGRSDELWVVVLRSREGCGCCGDNGDVIERHIEWLSQAWALPQAEPEAVHLDDSLSYDGWSAHTPGLLQAFGVFPNVTLTAFPEVEGAIDFTGLVGRRIALRQRSSPARASDRPREMHIRVDAVLAPDQVAGTIVLPFAEGGFDGYFETDQWAIVATQVAGLDHLECEPVTIVADGGLAGTAIVQGGSVEVPFPGGALVHVGHSYVAGSHVEPPPLDVPGQGLQGRRRRASRARIRVKDTLGLQVVVQGRAERLPTDRTADDPTGRPPRLKSTIAPVAIPMSHDREPVIRFEPTLPLPGTIAAVILEVTSDA